ncbi:unnamed protein product [Paramecium sonneborni]|uniref:Uncharacterized protein n=1 Tax=Paramecium sonneborni TaxID=65129 RepID=A0A8S1RF66_9CILI|nr:unnamed protein product [Paramecium sonneborni]
MLNTSINFFEENDIIKLRKYLIGKENEWKKDKAVLEQKIQLLELQLDDYKSREFNYKKLNETITQAINDTSTAQKRSVSELQKNVDIQQKDHNKVIYKEQIKSLELQVRSLTEQLQEKDQQGKEMELQFQKQYYQYDHRIIQLEQEKTQCNQENAKLKEQILKLEESQKQREQQYKSQLDQEIQRMKDLNMQDNDAKQSDYESKYSQLSLLYEKEKEQLQQRISKCQNTIKRYQQHIEQNIDIVNIKQQYEEQIQQLQQQNSVLQSQFQYERQILLQQIDELKKQQRDHIMKESINYHESTSKKRSVDAVKIKSSLQSYDSPVQCKSFHIASQDTKGITYNQYIKNQSNQSLNFTQKQLQQSQQQQQQQQNNQSFEKCSKQNDGLPISIDQFNLMRNKKQKSQSTLSIPTSNNYNLNSLLQEASIFQQNQESFQLDSNSNPKEDCSKLRILRQLNPNIGNRQLDYNRSVKNDQYRQVEQTYQRSASQEGLKSSVSNLSKMLGQTEISYQQQSNSTQQQTNNTSLNSLKVPVFTQNQLNSLKNNTQYIYPCATLRMNENHVSKVRYNNNNHSVHEEIKQNKENQQPTKKQSRSDIKMIIGKLLQTKVKQNDNLDKTSQFSKFNRI